MSYPDPQNPLEGAADEALSVFAKRVAELGGTVETVVIMGWVDGVYPNAITAVHSEGDDIASPTGLLSFLLAQATELSKVLGIKLQIFGVDPGRG